MKILLFSQIKLEEGPQIDNYQQEEGLLSIVPSYTLTFTPPITVFNHLPYTLSISHKSLCQPTNLDPSSSTQIFKIHQTEKISFKFELLNYLGSDWQATLEVSLDKADDTRPLTFSSGEIKKKVEIAVRTVRCPAMEVYVHSPYWLVNKTGNNMVIRGCRNKVEHESSTQDEILLFRYKRNYPKKLKIKVADSDFSSSFSVDSVGTDGLVVCRDLKRDKKFRVSCYTEFCNLEANIKVAEGSILKGSNHLQLTRIVTFMPYFIVRNMTSRPLRFMEENDKMDLWNDLEVGECKAFWPEGDDHYMFVKSRDSKIASEKFHFNSIHTTVLRMERGKALVVKVSRDSINKSPMVISLEKYTAGDVPVRVENWCSDVVIKLRQQKSNQVTLVPQQHKLLYTWDDPTLPRNLMWSVYDHKREEYAANINQDGDGHCLITLQTPVRSQSEEDSSSVTKKRHSFLRMRGRRRRAKTLQSSSEEDKEEANEENITIDTTRSAGRDDVTIYWVSYTEHQQRVLFFTQVQEWAELMRAPKERASLEVILSMISVGVSLVTPRSEVCYCSLQSSPATWELLFNGKWKTFPSLELSAWLDDQYLNNSNGQVNLQNTLHVDFDKMVMYKPLSMVRIRRVQQPALFLHMRQSKHFKALNLVIQNFQVDDQSPEAKFPTVISSHTTSHTADPFLCLNVLAAGHPKHVSLIGHELNAKLSEDFVCGLEDFIAPLWHRTSIPLHMQLKQMLTPITFQWSLPPPPSPEEFSLERVCIAGLSLSLSFVPSAKQSSLLGTYSDVTTSMGTKLREVRIV